MSTEKLVEKKGVKGAPLKSKFTLEELRLELSKIEWPDRSRVIQSTNTVLVILFVFIVFISVVDFGFSKLIIFLQSLR
jgi:preprotein translocase subunit SecE